MRTLLFERLLEESSDDETAAECMPKRLRRVVVNPTRLSKRKSTGDCAAADAFSIVSCRFVLRTVGTGCTVRAEETIFCWLVAFLMSCSMLAEPSTRNPCCCCCCRCRCRCCCCCCCCCPCCVSVNPLERARNVTMVFFFGTCWMYLRPTIYYMNARNFHCSHVDIFSSPPPPYKQQQRGRAKLEPAHSTHRQPRVWRMSGRRYEIRGYRTCEI